MIRGSDPAHALSAVETESLRQLRTRLDRPATSDAAKAVLGRVFLETVARVGLDVEASQPGEEVLPVSTAEAEAADMTGLRSLCARLARLRVADARAFARALDARVPQAVVSRRLALAGREPAKTTQSSPP